MDLEINKPNPKKPDEGIIRKQEVIPQEGIVEKRDDLLRDEHASDATMDDPHRKLA
jgi:hypothetical protein